MDAVHGRMAMAAIPSAEELLGLQAGAESVGPGMAPSAANTAGVFLFVTF